MKNIYNTVALGQGADDDEDEPKRPNPRKDDADKTPEKTGMTNKELGLNPGKEMTAD